MASRTIVTISLVLLVIVLAAFGYSLISSISGKSKHKAAKEYQEIVRSKNIAIINSYCTKNGAVIEVSNVGFSKIKLPGLHTPSAKIKRYIENPGFEKDSNHDNIPDFWEVELPKVSVVLATDLSNSMQRCLDEYTLQEVTPDKNTILLLHMNEGSGNMIFDSSGNGNNGSIKGASWVTGKFGKALEFKGNDYVALSKPYTYFDRGITIAAWVKTDDGYGTILGYDKNEIFRLEIWGGRVRWSTRNASETDVLWGSTHVNDGNWHHIAATYDPSSGIKRIYVDGKVDAEKVWKGGRLGTGTTRYGFLGVGSMASSFDGSKVHPYFEGIMDELVVYNRSLSQAEIESMAKGYVTNCPADSYEGPSDCRYTIACPTNCSAWVKADEKRYCYQLESGYVKITYKKAWEVDKNNCIFLEDETDCSSTPNYPNEQGFVPDCDRGYEWLSSCNNNYPYDTGEVNLSNCSYVHGCSSTVCSNSGKKWSGNLDFGPIQIKPSCNATECDVGDVYENCSWIERAKCDESACGSKYDAGTKIVSSEWKDSCAESECTIDSKYTKAECIEAEKCSDVEGYVDCSENCEPSCGASEICCCLKDSLKYLCVQYADKCCGEKKERCQEKSFECCDEKRKCCKQNIKCCANKYYCEIDKIESVDSCSIGFSNGAPDPEENNCQTWKCEYTTKKCLVCNTVAIRLAKKLDKIFIDDVISKGHKIGLISYGTNVVGVSEITNDSSILKSSVDSYVADKGQTCISCVINSSINLLKNQPNKRYLVLMSDGEANTMLNGTYDKEGAKKEAIELAEKAYKEYGISIYTIGFGKGAGIDTLKEIAEKTNGKFYKSEDAEELKEIYSKIAEEISAAMDDEYKVNGKYSMKIVSGKGLAAMSKYIEIDPSYTYAFSHYVKPSINKGYLTLKILSYDSSYSLLEEKTLKIYNFSFDDFKREEFNVSFNPNTKYVRIVYEWSANPEPAGTVWIDDIFLGIPTGCKKHDGIAKCEDIEIRKKGNTELQPYFDDEEIEFLESTRFIDVNCEGKCEYEFMVEGKSWKTEVYCHN